ncbi:MAG: class I SAM-dependent methyltransferase [Acidimicrobiales bacterium]
MVRPCLVRPSTTSSREHEKSPPDFDRKRDRLGTISTILDPVTFRRLEGLGVSEGWSCAEVGAGTGAVVSWLSARVGPTGRVLATELDTRYLDGLGLANVEVRHADICTAAPDEDAFDLVHTRLVLMHVADRDAALRHLVDALRPGGRLCIEEPDFSTLAAHPPSAAIERITDAVLDDFERAGSDWRFGLAVPGACEGVGVSEIAAEGELSVVQAGTVGAEPVARLFENVGPRLVRDGHLAQRELSEAVAVVRRPSAIVITSPLIVSTVARKC